ncbi:MAG: hypothetical protein ACOYJC_06555 [Christensenellales bacterium]|jgi:hypothetical protein
MATGHSDHYSYLDRIRINEGVDKCRAALNEVFQRDARRAAALLNDSQLTFTCLYILRGQIEGLHIQRYLSSRNVLALRIASQISASEASEADYLSSRQDSVHSVLKWILKTGSAQEIPEDDYEEILDVAVSVLINTYRDRDILPLVANLIFQRNRNGRYIHDLVWALFQVHDPLVLKLIAQHVRSSEPKDARLAAELLNIDETNVPADEDDKEGRYAGYLHWLEENEPYLYFTEESFQYANKPAFSAVDLERKYLQQGVPSYDSQPISPSEEANETLAAFKQLSVNEQKALSEYSQKIHDKSAPAWKEWLHAPVSEQIKIAKAGSEGDV